MTTDVHALERLPADDLGLPGIITSDGCSPTCDLATTMNTSMMCVVEDTSD
jgi:hypothetical protein